MDNTTTVGAPVEAALMPEMTEVPVPVDFSVVTNTILKFCKENREHALRQTREMYDRIARARKIYRCEEIGGAKSTSDYQEIGADIQLPEASNHIDTAKGTFYANLFQNNDVWKAEAQENESQDNVDATKAVVDAQLRAKGFTTELERCFHRFLTNPTAGMKACIEVVDEPDYQRLTVPVDQVIGFLSDQQGQGRSVTSVSEETFEDENGIPSVLYDSIGTVTRKYFYSKAVDMRNIAFGDVRRMDSKAQPSIHELHILNEDEIFYNQAFICTDELGPPDANGEKTALRLNDTTSGNGEINANFREYKIWENWSSLPIVRWMKQGVFTPEQWEAFCEFYNITDPNEANVPQKWCVIDCESVKAGVGRGAYGVILQIKPNYLHLTNEYPYDFASYIDGDTEIIGQSLLERIEPLTKSLNAMHNMFADNLRSMLYQAIGYKSEMDLDENTIRKLFKRNGLAKLEGNQDLSQMLIFMADHIPDVTRAALSGMGAYANLLGTAGIPDVVQGKGQSETATQDTINNFRGQQKVDSPFRRIVLNVIVPQITKIIGLVYRWFDKAQYITVAGESGAKLGKMPRMITPREITNKIKVIPLATFDFADRPVRAQQLLAALNIAASVVPPPVVIRLLGIALEYQGLDREVVDIVTNNFGVGTDPEDELMTMILNPQDHVAVRPDDNHQMALEAAFRYKSMYPRLELQPNFIDYVTKHTIFFQQQQAMTAAMPQGKPVQAPADGGPQSQEGATKQAAQLENPSDGGEAATGMTGQGGMGAVTGAPLPSRVLGTLAKGAQA